MLGFVFWGSYARTTRYEERNSAVLWSLGIAGSATTCKNKPMGALMKKLAACVGVWSHSAVKNDKLKDIQRQLEEDFHNCLLYTSPSPRD